MKKTFLFLSLTIILAGINLSCNLIGSKSQTDTSKEDSLLALANAPIIKFEEESFDFGTLTEGDSVQHTFKFTNVGRSPLQINEVQVQCGCTVASKPEKPVAVGQADQIIVQFNSEGKVGVNKKFVTIYSNANPPESVISFTAVVEEKRNADKAVSVKRK